MSSSCCCICVCCCWLKKLWLDSVTLGTGEGACEIETDCNCGHRGGVRVAGVSWVGRLSSMGGSCLLVIEADQ